jgi:pimeloyl-ACP methyl ester carboxylesterase
MIQTTKMAHRTIKARDLDIFYREAAPAVLLLHGFPTSSQMFRNLIPALADRCRVLAPDCFRCGEPDTREEDHQRHEYHLRAGVSGEW